jgi:hypothetical protein
MLTCRDVTRLQSERCERELSARERMELRLHTMVCRGCRRYGKQIDFIRRAARAVREGDTG